MINQMKTQQRSTNQQVSRTSKHQPSSSEAIFNLKRHSLRKQSDAIRTQIFALMDQVCNYLQNNPNYKQLISKLQHANFLLSEKNTQQLVDTIKKLEYSLRESVEEQVFDMDVADKQIEVSKKELQQIRMHQAQMNTKNEDAIAEIITKKHEFQNMHQQLQGLTQEQSKKRQELLQAQMKKKSFEQRGLKKLSQNWPNQTSYIREIIKQRANTHSQVQRVNKVLEMLQKKVKDLHKIKQQYVRAKEENQQLFHKNIELNDKIKVEQARKHRLLDNKRNSVLAEEIQFAGLIARDWSQTQQASRELLFEIIKEINKKLPLTKLKDVQQIIRSADNYFSNNSRLSSVENAQVQQLVQDDV